MSSWIPRGTLLNTATVLFGGLLGWWLGGSLEDRYRDIALSGLSIVTVGIGLKMLLASKSIIVVAASIALGGVIGMALGVQTGIAEFAEWAKIQVGAHDDNAFVDVVIATSVLFCVGPMTLLGCMQDRLTGKSELLSLKSTMDGFVALFYGIVSGPAMVVTALVVLVFQSGLTFAAGALKPVADDEPMLTELSATGGVMLVAIGLNIMEVKELPAADFLPALLLAPFFIFVGRKFIKNKPEDGTV